MAGSGAKQKMKRRLGSGKVEENDIMKEIPPRLVSCLMPFQREGVLFAVRKGGRCLIADEMGLGKTLQAIAVASYFQSEWPVLIIVPSSLRYAWIEELEKWLPDILPHEINLIQGGFDTGGIADAKITIVTYGLLSCSSSGMVKEALRARQFKVAICDESHFFKNSQTQCCKAVAPLLTSATRCILLSGTPALAKPSELFTQLDALLPGKFGSFWSFTKKYCAAYWQHFGRRRHWKADGASNLDELQQRLKSVMIRREKNSVLTQLPPKQRQKILFALKDSQTKKEILSTFEELKPILKGSKSSLAANLLGGDRNTGPEGAGSAQPPDTNVLSRIQRLYRLTGEAKIGPAREYIQMLCENANLKFLVFAYHHAMMDGLQQTLWDKKIKFVRIDGQTKPSDRQLYVQQFQSDKDTRVAILSILAAGVGLTLTAATLVVFAELYWTPGVMVQCEDRAHRIGQTSTVPVHYLVARETMDEWVWSAVCRKMIVTSKALMGKSQALQADAGDRYQVDLLSAADAYTPVDNSEMDISQLILSQRPSDQKSILDFFGSQHDPSQQSSQTSTKSSTSCGASQDTDEPMDEKGSAPATPSAGCSKGRKRLFPVVTSLKKPSQSSSKCEFSQESVLVDSSDDELKSICQNPSRLLGNETGAENDRNDSKTQNRSQTKTGSSRKRKCVVNDAENNSDSVFVETPSSLSHSVKKRKCRTKSVPSLPKSCSKSDMKKTGEGELEMSSRRDMKRVGGDQWACSSCTFSNSSLLPFCEICETPRKGKGQADEQKTQIPGKLSETTKTTSHASLEEDFELSSPVCSSTHICKQRPQENLFQRTGRVEPSCEGDDEETPSRSTSRRGAKRNLMFGVGESQTDAESVDGKTAQNIDKNALRPSRENSDAVCSPETVGVQPSQGVTEAACKYSEDTELMSFQLNSSMDEDNGYTSPCLFESEDEEEQKTLVIVDEDAEHISSFSSASSTPPCNTTGELSVTEPVCSDYGSALKSKSTDLFTTDKILTAASLCVNSDGIATENKRIEPDIGEVENSDLPEMKPPKRKSFILGTPERQSTEIPPKKHTPSVADISRNRSDGTGETCVENLTDHDTNLTSKEKHTGFTVVKRKPVVRKSNCSEISQTIMAVEKSNGSEARQALSDEASEQTEESTVVCEGDETGLSNQTCDRTDDCRAAAEESGTVQGEKQRGVSMSDGVDTVTSATQQDQQQTSGDDVHSSFMFCCSVYTGRVYLFDKHGAPLKANFLPLDVELDNVSELPPILHHPQHLRLARHFVRHWNSLTDTKRRLIMKRGLKFHNPLAAYDLVRTDLANNKQRYQTKGDQAKAAVKRAQEVNGNIRVLSKHGPPVQLCVSDQDSKQSEEGGGSTSADTTHSWPRGYVQAMTADGRPLCVHCQQPCTSLVSHESSSDGSSNNNNSTAWNTRFCSRVCADAHWMKTNTGYLRSSVYDVQHGVCQLCGFDAHTFFCQIRNSVDRKLRVEKITNSKFCKLGNALKKQMVARPYEGLFWHVDHIRPVWDGGGQCDIDNLRTLCAPCHTSVTAKQATKRAHARKLSSAACAGDITAFFKKI